MNGDDIVQEVAARHGMTPAAMQGPTRQERFLAARRECAKRLQNELGLGNKQIARLLGGISPSTVSTYTSDSRWADRKERAMQRRRPAAVTA